MKGWVGLGAIGLLVLVEIALVEHLAVQDGAAVLLAAWEPVLALEFLAVMGLRVGLYLLVPPALVLLLAWRFSWSSS